MSRYSPKALRATVAVSLRVRVGADALEIEVENPADVGPGTRPGGGRGLIGIAERVTLLGGTLTVDSADRSWRVDARLPYGGGR